MSFVCSRISYSDRARRIDLVSVAAALVAIIPLLSAEESRSFRTDENGTRVLSPLPPPGVHPRVYFTADEYPRIRRRLDTTRFGKKFKPTVVANASQVRRMYADLAELEENATTTELIVKHVRSDEGRNIRWGMASVYAVAYDDAELRDFMARVLTSYARLLLASKDDKDSHVGVIQKLWTTTQYTVGESWTIGASGVAVSYDVLHPTMTETQRSIVRKAIATATKGRTPYGSGLPIGFGVSNHYGYHGDLAVLLCAIEGEEGFDRPTFERIRKILLDYWSASFTALGACHEDGYGPNLGLRAGSRGLLALARRGDNIFATEKYRNFLDHFVIDHEPFPGGRLIGGASGGPYPEIYPTSIIIARYMHPLHPSANLGFRHIHHIEDGKFDRRIRWQGHLDYTMFGGDWIGPESREEHYRSTNLPLARFFPARGKLISRSDWTNGALQLVFDARPDAHSIGHDKVDRGNFSLASHGRVWATSGDFGKFNKSEENSLVHIDGKAQPWKAPSVRFLAHHIDAISSSGVADLEYAYDWQWSPPWPDKSTGFSKEWTREDADPRDLGWPREHAPSWLPKSLYGSATGYASRLPAGNWLHRRAYNPIERAIRSTLAVNGERPYVIIADDIRKDSEEHTYSWFLQIPLDVSLDRSDGNDFVLREAEDDRRLLLRALQADVSGGKLSSRTEDYVAHFDKRRGTKTPGRRLILEGRSVAPRFKFMLFPHIAGDPLPRTSRDGQKLRWRIEWAKQRDTVTFDDDQKPDPIRVQRD